MAHNFQTYYTLFLIYLTSLNITWSSWMSGLSLVWWKDDMFEIYSQLVSLIIWIYSQLVSLINLQKASGWTDMVYIQTFLCLIPRSAVRHSQYFISHLSQIQRINKTFFISVVRILCLEAAYLWWSAIIQWVELKEPSCSFLRFFFRFFSFRYSFLFLLL